MLWQESKVNGVLGESILIRIDVRKGITVYSIIKNKVIRRIVSVNLVLLFSGYNFR